MPGREERRDVSTKAKLTATVGAGCCAVLLSYVPQFEGKILRGYADPVGIVTACSGHTKTAVLGRPYTEAECEEFLSSDLLEHADGVLKCTPGLKGQTYRLAAATSWAYNVGVRAYCNSTTARRFNAGDYAGGCKAMNESDNGTPQWVYATKPDGTRIVLQGLVKRRAIERSMCEGRIG